MSPHRTPISFAPHFAPSFALALSFALSLAHAPSLQAARGQDFFEPAAFADEAGLAASSDRFWKSTGLKKIPREELRKVAIVEFNVEYLTTHVYDSNNQAGGLLGIGLKLGGVGKKHWELDEEFKRSLPERLYREFVRQLDGRGFEVVPLAELRAAEAFQRLRGEEGEVGKKKGLSGGRGYSAQKKQVYEVHAVEGLLDLKDGAFASMNNVKAQAEMLHELGADSSLRVWVRLGLDPKGRPVLMAESHVGVVAGVEVANRASGTAVAHAKHWGSLDAKRALAWAEDARAGKDFKGGKGKVIDIDEATFERALNEMYPAFMGMAVSLLE